MKQRPQDTLPGALALAARQWKALLLLNLLFLLCSIPIVTAGMSLGALVRCCMRLCAGETFNVPAAFFEEFKKNRWENTKACGLWILLVAAAALAVWLCWRSLLRLLLLVALLALFGSGVVVYYLPMVMMVDIPPLVALQNAFALSLVLVSRTIPSMGFVVIWEAVCVIALPYTGVLFLLAGVSLPVLVCGAIGWPGVRKLVVEDENAVSSSDQYYLPAQQNVLKRDGTEEGEENV